ncbi:hypothetical protein VCHA53O466_50340 [Vibrio chagasii]|nr:hypothetical protein VCHA53O466_50340 [Vibrio chagasii]
MERAKFKNTYGFECDMQDHGKECEVLSVIADPSDDTLIAPHIMPQLKIKFDVDGSERLAFPQEIDEKFWPDKLKVCQSGIDAMAGIERPTPCDLALKYIDYWHWGLEIGKIKLDYVGESPYICNDAPELVEVQSCVNPSRTESLPHSQHWAGNDIGNCIEVQLERYDISKTLFAQYLVDEGYVNNLVEVCGDGTPSESMVLYVAGLIMHEIEIKECIEELALSLAREKVAKDKAGNPFFFRNIVNFFRSLL